MILDYDYLKNYCVKCNKKYANTLCKWCRPCQINHLKENFTNWTSENEKIDNFIQEIQSKMNNPFSIVFEWVPYNQFNYVKETGKHDCVTVYSAKWKYGLLEYNVDESKYKRNQNKDIVLKVLNEV